VKAKAIALLSGGLDSTLAVRLMLDQDIEVHALSFVTPFCTCNRKGRCEARRVADEFGIPIRVTALTDQFTCQVPDWTVAGARNSWCQP